MKIETHEHRFKLLKHCANGKHQFRDNAFGFTWCFICGQHSTKSSNTPLLKEEKIITTNLK